MEQTKAIRINERKISYPQKAYSLRLSARFRKEQCKVMARCLEKAAEIAKIRKNEEMLLQTKRRAESLQRHSSKILQRTAKAVLQCLKEKG